jgi:hypothetical protein
MQDKTFLKLFKVLSEAIHLYEEFDLECSNVGKLYEFRVMHKAEQRAVLTFSVSLLKLAELEKDVKFIRRLKSVLDLVLVLNK